MHSFRKGKLSLGICPESRTSSAYPETLKPPSAGGHAGWQGWPASAHEPPRCPSPVVRGQTPPHPFFLYKIPRQEGSLGYRGCTCLCLCFFHTSTAVHSHPVSTSPKKWQEHVEEEGGWQHGQDQVVFSAALLKPQPSVAL